MTSHNPIGSVINRFHLLLMILILTGINMLNVMRMLVRNSLVLYAESD